MIAIDCRPLQDDSKFRGIGTVVRHLIQYLPSKESYCLFIEKGKGAIDNCGLPVIQFKAPKFSNYGQELGHFLMKNNIKLMHFTAQYNIPDNFDFPFSVTIHDLFNPYFLINQKKYQKLLHPMIKKLSKAIHIIAISEYTKQMILSEMSYPEENISVIYNGFDPTIATISSNTDTKNIKSLQLNHSKPFILYVGNYEKRKNFIHGLKGFVKFKEKHPKFNLIACTGHPPLIKSLSIIKILMKHKSSIQCMPYISQNNMAYLYKNANLLLFPSLAEGFGLPILEAMSVKTPAVVSNASALPEVGKNAVFYVDPLSPESISNGLEQVATNPNTRKSLISNMDNVLSQFKLSQQGERYHKTLTQLKQAFVFKNK